QPCLLPTGSPAAGAPFGQRRALGAECRVFAVARVEPDLVGEAVEDLRRYVADQRREPRRVLFGVADAAREQRVAGEQMAAVGRVVQDDRPRRVALDADDLERARSYAGGVAMI